MCESIAKLAKARKSKIAQDDTDHDPSNGRFTSGSGGSAKPAKKSDASNPDHKWGSWKEFNDDYTKALQKRNAAAREHDKATRTGQESPKTAAKLERAKAFADAHSDHPNRPSSSVTYNFNRPRVAKDATGSASLGPSEAHVDPGQYGMGGEPPNSSASVQEQATNSMGYRGSIGQDSAIRRLVRARRPKMAQDADWDESKHKRASNGQFGSGGGGSAPKSASEKKAGQKERGLFRHNLKEGDAVHVEGKPGVHVKTTHNLMGATAHVKHANGETKQYPLEKVRPPKTTGESRPAFTPGGYVKASSPRDHQDAFEWHRQKASDHEINARTLLSKAKDMRKEGDHGEAKFLSQEAQMHRDASMAHSSAAMLHNLASTNSQHSDKANSSSSEALQKSKGFAPGSYTARHLNK